MSLSLIDLFENFWTEAKSEELVNARQADAVIQAYKIGFRVSPRIVDLLLLGGDSDRVAFFYDKGYQCKAPYDVMRRAVENGWTHVLKWLVDHGFQDTLYLNYYNRHGLPGVEKLFATGIKPSIAEYMFISQDEDRCVELMQWLDAHGCKIGAGSDAGKIALGNARIGNKQAMLAFLQKELGTSA